MRVLLAEDYEDIRAGLRVALEMDGHEVAEAEDGRRAMELFDAEAARGRTFDVAILDFNLPHFKGDAVAAYITKAAGERGVRKPEYIALTGSQDAHMVGRLQTAGVYELVIKGGDEADFARLRDRISGRRLAAA